MEERLARLEQADTCEAFIQFYKTALAFERELQRLATSTEVALKNTMVYMYLQPILIFIRQ